MMRQYNDNSAQRCFNYKVYETLCKGPDNSKKQKADKQARIASNENNTHNHK